MNCSGSRLVDELQRSTLLELSPALQHSQCPTLKGTLLQTLASGPKADAIILLGSLYTYPWTEEALKQQIVVTIKDVARTESDQFNRSEKLGFLFIQWMFN